MLAVAQSTLFYMVAVAQLAERRIVVPNVAGSTPVSHPIYFQNIIL